MLYISTNEVFDGDKGEPYLETDEPNPINAYGRSKLEGEGG
jgi:dTDP-4-dehydrorhamnose reductase